MMTSTCTNYMYDGKWTEKFIHLSSIDYYTEKKPDLIRSDKTIILPARDSQVHGWGSGGAIDETGSLIEASRLGDLFGEIYSFHMSEVTVLDETVYYIPVIPKHWGHFLIDVLCRFWFLLEGKDQGFRIAYCAHEFGETGITGNYLEALELLGVEKDRLLYVDRPTKFTTVIIPTPTFGDGNAYSAEYIKIIEKIKKTVLQSEESLLPPRIDKIYFTRTKFRRSRYTEFGEKRIERIFRSNGFTVLSPESLTVREQIYYFCTCKMIASLSGTIAHQIMFSEPGNQYIILNRCCLPNYAQFAVNQMSPAEVINIDVYAKETTIKPQHWPIWVEANANLQKYLVNEGLCYPQMNFLQKIWVKSTDWLHYIYLRLRLRLKTYIRKAR